jgi:dihydrofolate reductase
MSISLIVAASENNAIGKNNQLLWHLPNDLKFFKNTTWGMPVIMGRKTFEAVNKPLPGRFNIVITRQDGWKADGVLVAKDLNDALQKATETNCKEIFIIGGGEIYKQSMEMADKIYLTRVHANIDGDTFFPVVDENKWQLITNQDFVADEKHAFAYSFQLWKTKPLTPLNS